MKKVSQVYADYFNKKIGMITIYNELKRVDSGDGHQYWVYFECDCGRSGHIIAKLAVERKCCGCEGKKKSGKSRLTHGKSKYPIYKTWQSVMERCYNKNSAHYKNYGARGISVCSSWHRFENFYNDMGDKPSRIHSIDRINNDGNYCKENCRWVTAKEQANNRRSTKYVNYKGRKCTVNEISEITGLPRRTITSRIFSGKSLDDPHRKTRAKRKYIVKIEGKLMTCKEAEKSYGVKARIIRQRIDRGWDHFLAATTKPRDYPRD